MFEIIKIFVEQIFKVVDLEKIASARKSGKMAEIGVGLFGMYSSLNSIYLTGIRIVTIIERSLERYEGDVERGHQTKLQTHQIEEQLKRQANNIVEFGHSFYAVSAHFEIIDPKSMREISMFLTEKFNIIRSLIGQFETFSRERAGHAFSAEYEQKLIAAAKIAGSEEALRQRNEVILEQVGLGPWQRQEESDQDLADMLKEYLRRRRPLEHLKSLESILDRLHASLLANFELKDILVRSGHKAPRDAGGGWLSLSIPQPDEMRNQSDEFMRGLQRDTLNHRIERARGQWGEGSKD